MSFCHSLTMEPLKFLSFSKRSWFGFHRCTLYAYIARPFLTLRERAITSSLTQTFSSFVPRTQRHFKFCSCQGVPKVITAASKSAFWRPLGLQKYMFPQVFSLPMKYFSLSRFGIFYLTFCNIFQIDINSLENCTFILDNCDMPTVPFSQIWHFSYLRGQTLLR